MTAGEEQAGFSSLRAENEELAAKILRACHEKGVTLGCAESCTGGLIAATFTELPGSSESFKGGIVSYWVEVKQNLLGVPEDILTSFGVVSRECAEAMAQGARRALGCSCAVSTTGIAGPAGAEPGKPVGTVCIAVATPETTQSKRIHCPSARREVRLAAVNCALHMVDDAIDRAF